MQDLIDAHLADLMAAQDAQNTAIEAAQHAFGTAVASAQTTYADVLNASRTRIMSEIDSRLRVWNGEIVRPLQGPTAKLPEATPLSVAPEVEVPADEE
jgi:hypothetical protein